MKLLVLVSAIALCTTISCKKEVKTDDKINTVEVKKNNQPWPASKFSSNLTSENRLTIFLYGKGEEYIAIQLNQPERTGTITEFNAVYLNLLGGDVIIDNHLIDMDKPHHLEITAFDAKSKQIAGKFSFTLKREERFAKSSGEQSNDFSGHFNMEYSKH
ncbi:hypothetical protein ACLOAU_08110 [Niabella sp. CJ426]|uniref:hypothetical protein n=1 Tax=unclassified Niabella TaxID=2646634 RepID=UPI003D026BF3